MELPIGTRWIGLWQQPELLQTAAQWFADKWGIAAALYEESMKECLTAQKTVPQWYVVLTPQQQIIAGAGVIENDFHTRKDLTPNLCALFVEKAYRNQGVAKALLDFIRRDMAGRGVETLYLVTDHAHFYEACGWTFLTMVECEDQQLARMYAAATLLD